MVDYSGLYKEIGVVIMYLVFIIGFYFYAKDD